MITKRPFRTAFLLSIGVHSLLFAPVGVLLKGPVKSEIQPIEITYILEKRERPVMADKPVPPNKRQVSLKDGGRTSKERETIKKAVPPKEADTPKAEAVNKKAALTHTETFNLNSLPKAKEHSKSLNYLRSIRNGIKRYVHKKYEAAMGEGDLMLHFVLNADGSVRSVSIIKDNLSKNERLRNLCLDSVYFSSPFAPFPKELNLPHAAFNIGISFKKR